jgi:hypothetical protein
MASRDQSGDRAHRDPHSANAGLTPHDFRVPRNAVYDHGGNVVRPGRIRKSV